MVLTFSLTKVNLTNVITICRMLINACVDYRSLPVVCSFGLVNRKYHAFQMKVILLYFSPIDCMLLVCVQLARACDS